MLHRVTLSNGRVMLLEEGDDCVRVCFDDPNNIREMWHLCTITRDGVLCVSNGGDDGDDYVAGLKEEYESLDELSVTDEQSYSSECMPLNFGEIVLKLRAILNSTKNSSYFDVIVDCSRIPFGIAAYRGDAEQVAMVCTVRSTGSPVKLYWLVELLEKAIGYQLTGWKGGLFTVTHTKEVYVVTDVSQTSTERVVDIVAADGHVYIKTKVFD